MSTGQRRNLSYIETSLLLDSHHILLKSTMNSITAKIGQIFMVKLYFIQRSFYFFSLAKPQPGIYVRACLITVAIKCVICSLSVDSLTATSTLRTPGVTQGQGGVIGSKEVSINALASF